MKFRLFAALLALSAAAHASDTLTLYTSRKDANIKPLIDLYEARTGVHVRHTTDIESALIEKIRLEGAGGPADLLLTQDAASLSMAKNLGLLSPVKSAALDAGIPKDMRDAGGYWYGISTRVRTVVYDSAKWRPSDFAATSYADLADPKWRGKLCLRTSKKVYNQSLIAMLIGDLGEAKTEKVVKGWVDNLAAPVFADDTVIVKAIDAGQCGVGLVNAHYFYMYKDKNPGTRAAIAFIGQKSGGVNSNITGVALVKTSRNKAAARDFMEWLATPEVQKLYADGVKEIPANLAVLNAAREYPVFKRHPLGAGDDFIRNQIRATMLADRVGYY